MLPIRDMLPILIGWLVWFFSPIIATILATGFILIADLFTGIWAAKIRKETVTTRKAARTLKKMVFYNLAIITGHVCGLYLTDLIPWVKVISGLIVLIEMGSLLENISTVTGVKLFTFFRYYVKKNFNIDMSDYSGADTIKEAQSYTNLTGKKVLIVDDNELNLNILSRYLESFKVKVTRLASGPAALVDTYTNSYDVIFMDIHMPGLNGLDTIKLIRDDVDNPNKTTPIIIVSSLSPDKYVHELHNGNVNGIITKPLDLDQLYTQIVHVLNQK